jgi:hypothetical protein
MPRWIHVSKPFDYFWPDRSAVTHFHEEALGDQFVKDEIADFAVANRYATEGKADKASRSKKGKAAAKTADAGSSAPVGDANAADADRSADRPPVDDDAG